MFSEQFVAVLRQERERQLIPTAKLAERLDLHPHVIKDWEQRKRTPRLHSAARWAEALGFTLTLRRDQ